jgi:hypothetical protein
MLSVIGLSKTGLTSVWYPVWATNFQKLAL